MTPSTKQSTKQSTEKPTMKSTKLFRVAPAAALLLLLSPMVAGASHDGPDSGHGGFGGGHDDDDGGGDHGGGPGELRLRKAESAELNAFGCVSATGGLFAGRYRTIQVFASLPAPEVRRRFVPARVFGQIAVGLPEVLSGAFIEWDIWLGEDGMATLYGSAKRPDGSVVVANLKLPRQRGVHTVQIVTTVAGTGATLTDDVVCTVR